jgi:hypothetical protein
MRLSASPSSVRLTRFPSSSGRARSRLFPARSRVSAVSRPICRAAVAGHPRRALQAPGPYFRGARVGGAPPDLRRHLLEGILSNEEVCERLEISEPVGERVELVAREPQCGEPAQPPELAGEREEIVAVQAQVRHLCEQPDLRRGGRVSSAHGPARAAPPFVVPRPGRSASRGREGTRRVQLVRGRDETCPLSTGGGGGGRDLRREVLEKVLVEPQRGEGGAGPELGRERHQAVVVEH